MIRKKIIFIFLIFFFITINSHPTKANLRDDLIEKLNDIKNISFDFEQKIANKIEIGNCIIEYQKLMQCDYNDTFRKRLISNGKTLAIIQKRYNKIFYYKLSSTPLEYILDKEFIIQKIKNSPINNYNDKLIYISYQKNKQQIDIFFDKKKLIIQGWITNDIYNNQVQFKIKNPIINQNINKNLFKIPKLSDFN